MLLGNNSVVPKRPPVVLDNGKSILSSIDHLMTTKKPFTRQGLKLDELAEQLEISKHTVSKVLNEVYVHGFSHYIREYRVNEAKQLIQSRPDLSLEGIGYEAGFNSKSAFFEAFKKVASCTPAEYKKSLYRAIRMKFSPDRSSRTHSGLDCKMK